MPALIPALIVSPRATRRPRAMLSPAVASVAQLALIVLYPGYLTFKTLEHDRKKPDAARGWCVYWVVASAWMTMIPWLDRAFDASVGLYRECKLAFSIYLWHPRWQGALYVYDGFLAPFLIARESVVDDALARTFELVGGVVGEASAKASACVRRAVNDALATATEAQLAAQSGAGAASGRADRIRRRAD